MSAHRNDALFIARRYATAIFALAVESGKESMIVQEIQVLGEAISKDAGLHGVLANPLISRSRKADILVALAAKGDALTGRAMRVLADGGRAELVPTVARMLQEKLSAYRGELVATVTSAQQLTSAVQKQLAMALAQATGKAVQIELAQNPEILGGLVVQMGSLRLDASLAGALRAMRAGLQTAGAS